MEDHQPLGVGADPARHLERAGGRLVAVDLRIALVGEDAEIVALGEIEKHAPVAPVGHRALRVRGRADIGDRGAVEHVRGQAGEVRQVTGFGAAGQIDRLGPGRQRGHGVALVEGVRQQHQGLPAALALGREREAGVEEALAGAVERQDRALRVAVGLGDAVAPRQPVRDRLAQLRNALVRRIAREAAGVLGQDAGHEIRDRVPRLADRHGDLRPAGRDAVQERAQAREGVFGQRLEAPGELHRVPLAAGAFSRLSGSAENTGSPGPGPARRAPARRPARGRGAAPPPRARRRSSGRPSAPPSEP